MVRTTPRPRAGFTLLELLVVIALVTLLLAVAVGTYFRVRGTAEKRVTEVMTEKIALALDQHVKAIVEQAREEFQQGTPPCSFVIETINNIAKGDRRRALAIY